MAQWFHRSQLGSSLFIDIHTEGVSDNFFFENLNEDILGTKQKNYLTKKVNAKWIGESLKFEGEIREYKDLNPFTSEQYETRPNFSLTFQNSYKGINFNLLSSYSKFAFDGSFNPFNKQKEITRKSIEPSLSYSKYFTSSSFSIAIGVEDLNYDVNSINFDRSSNWLETEYKLFFENRSDQSYKSLNPTFKFIVLNEESLLSESIDSRLMGLNYNNLFLRNWYSGPDRFLNQDRLIVGIEHQNIGAENDTNLSLSIGKAFFLKDEYSIGENNKRTSPLVMEFKQQIKSNLFTNGTLEIDSDLDRVHSSSFGLMYERDEDKKIELRSVYKRLNPSLSNMPWFDKDSPISQLELLSQWSISDQFIIFGKLLKDNEMHKSKDLSFGFQYSNCCMKAGLMKRKWKDQDYYTWYASPAEAFKALESGINPELQRDNIYFFFELRDIGRIGKEISEVISSTMLE